MLVPALLRYDRDAAALANHTSLVPGFGRSTLNAKAMEVLPFADGDGVSQASIDCRFFLESGDVGGNMLSIGVDSANTSGHDTGPNAAVRITGPLRSQEAVNTLFDVREPAPTRRCDLYTAFRTNGGEESTLGLMREWWAWNALGQIAVTQVSGRRTTTSWQPHRWPRLLKKTAALQR